MWEKPHSPFLLMPSLIGDTVSPPNVMTVIYNTLAALISVKELLEKMGAEDITAMQNAR